MKLHYKIATQNAQIIKLHYKIAIQNCTNCKIDCNLVLTSYLYVAVTLQLKIAMQNYNSKLYSKFAQNLQPYVKFPPIQLQMCEIVSYVDCSDCTSSLEIAHNIRIYLYANIFIQKFEFCSQWLSIDMYHTST